MNQLYKLLIGAAAILVASCGKEELEPVVVRDFPTFSALIEGQHGRANDDYWDAGDKIGITGGDAVNVCHVNRSSELLFTPENPDEQIYFPDANPIDYTAYYPYNPNRDATTGLINFSTADQENRRDFDFLWAAAQGSKDSPNVEFVFAHEMSKVTFVFKNGNDMDVTTLVRCRLNGLFVEGTFDTTTGICKADDTMETGLTTMLLTDIVEDEAVNPLFLIPQTLTAPLKLEIYDQNNQYYVCNLTVPDNELVAGFNYNYFITVSKTGMKVTGCTLSDWISENGEDSEASSSDD